MEGKIHPHEWMPVSFAEKLLPIDMKDREKTTEKASAPRVKQPSSEPISTRVVVKSIVTLDLRAVNAK